MQPSQPNVPGGVVAAVFPDAEAARRAVEVLVGSGVARADILVADRTLTDEPVEGPVVWSTKALLSQDDGLGSILRALFGYADTPHVIEVVTYAGYFVIAWLLSRTRLARAPITAPRPAASS